MEVTTRNGGTYMETTEGAVRKYEDLIARLKEYGSVWGHTDVGPKGGYIVVTGRHVSIAVACLPEGYGLATMETSETGRIEIANVQDVANTDTAFEYIIHHYNATNGHP